MIPLSPDQLRDAHALVANLNRGETLTQRDLDALDARWAPILQPSARDCRERFSIARPDGETTGISGPRWIFHLFGLLHRAAEIALATPTGLILLQRRSPTKDNWPGAFDMTVAGHIPQREDGSSMSFEEGAWKEIEEEIGLSLQNAGTDLVEGRLTPVGKPYFCYEGEWQRNPPFFDAEVRQVFAGTLTGDGLARIRFADGEVAGMLLATVDTAWGTLRGEAIATGLRYSLPRYLDWLEQHRHHRK
jgi:isopentenyldiphosphate isomerase